MCERAGIISHQGQLVLGILSSSVFYFLFRTLLPVLAISSKPAKSHAVRESCYVPWASCTTSWQVRLV